MAMAMLCLALPSWAAGFTIDGISYTILSGNTVEVASGNYTGKVVIPEKVVENGVEYAVTGIGNSAFYYCYAMTDISMPSTLTNIGESAFEFCMSLDSIVVPEGVLTIGNGAFGYCTRMSKLYLPKSVTSVATYVTFGTYNLNEIVVDEGNANYTAWDGALYNKDKTALYAYPNKRHENVVIPEGVTTIMDGAMWECNNVKSITLPESVTTLNPFCFYSCEGLKSINLPKGITSLPQGIFYYCSSLEEIEVPEKVTTIGQTALADCYELTTVKLGTSLTSIGVSAFMNSSKLKNIELPNGLKTLGMSSLRATAIESITIPKTCTSIGAYSFMACLKLKEILVATGNGKYTSKDGVLCNRQGWEIVAWPGGKASEYSVPAGITNIGEGAFYYCDNLEKIELCNDVSVLGANSFSDNVNLSKVVLGDKITSIRSSAFSYCTGLEEIDCRIESPLTISEDVFYKVTTSACKLIVPAGTKSAYETAAVWKGFIIQESTSELKDIETVNVVVRGGNGVIRVMSQEPIRFDVYALSGEKVYSGEDCEVSLSSGVYVVTIAGKSEKVIVR